MAFGNAPERKSPAEGKINVEGLQESGKQEVYWRYFACGKKAMSSMWKTGRSGRNWSTDTLLMCEKVKSRSGGTSGRASPCRSWRGKTQVHVWVYHTTCKLYQTLLLTISCATVPENFHSNLFSAAFQLMTSQIAPKYSAFRF